MELVNKSYETLVNFINKSSKNKKESDNNSVPEICKIIIKSGPKKGQVCSRINCHYHKLKSIVV